MSIPMRNIQYYCLFDDWTWDVFFMDIPENILGGTPSEDENAAVDYIYKYGKLESNIERVGIYSW